MANKKKKGGKKKLYKKPAVIKTDITFTPQDLGIMDRQIAADYTVSYTKDYTVDYSRSEVV
jgi:hypothetical protein